MMIEPDCRHVSIGPVWPIERALSAALEGTLCDAHHQRVGRPCPVMENGQRTMSRIAWHHWMDGGRRPKESAFTSSEDHSSQPAPFVHRRSGRVLTARRYNRGATRYLWNFLVMSPWATPRSVHGLT